MDHWTMDTSYNKTFQYTWRSWQVCPMLGCTQGPFSTAEVTLRNECSPINEDFWSCGPWHNILIPLQRVITPQAFAHSLKGGSRCVLPYARHQGRGIRQERSGNRKVNCLTGFDQGSTFNDYTINVSACTPGPLWPGRNLPLQLLKLPDPRAQSTDSTL